MLYNQMSPTDEDMVAADVSSGTHPDAYLYLLDEKPRCAPKWAHLMKMHWEYASYCELTTFNMVAPNASAKKNNSIRKCY